jgi:hypothetical protein
MTNDIDQAEKTLRQLEDQRDTIIGRSKTLAVQRQQISHAAFTGNAKAKAQLDKLNAETQTMGLELENIQAAIAQAQSILGAAHAETDRAADKAQALKLRDAIAEYIEEASELDASLEDMVMHANAMNDALTKIHRLGGQIPTHRQNFVLGSHCFKSALMKTPWKSELDFEHIPAHKFQTFKQLVSGWAATLMRDVERRIGEQTDKAA